MNKTLVLIHSLVCIFFLFLGACSRQSAPKIEDTITRSTEEQDRLNACSNLDLLANVLKYQNVLTLFKCTQWDKEFPSLHQSIGRISAESWDHVFNPINDAFLKNHVNRDRVFSNIRELDSKNGLDDFSHVLVALNETNFFDSVKAMFSCVENPSADICQNRKVPTKKSLKHIIRLVELNPETLLELSFLSRTLNSSLSGKTEDLRLEVNKFRNTKMFVAKRLMLVDSLVGKFLSGLSPEDRSFVSTLLRVGNKEMSAPWIYDWLKNSAMNREKFKRLLSFSVLEHPELVLDVHLEKEFYDRGLVCKYKTDGAENKHFTFDLKAGTGDYVLAIKEKSYKEFFDISSMFITGLKISSEVCREIDQNKEKGNLIRAATKIAQLFSDKSFYDVVRFVLTYSTSSSNSGKSFSENYYFPDMLASPIFSAANELNSEIIKNSADFFPVVYDILVSMPPEVVTSLANIVDEIAKVEHDLKFKGVADFWSFFTPEEKNFVFNFVDRHFDDGINYPLLFDFYAKFIEDFKGSQDIFKDAWSSDENRIDQSYLALQDLFYNFSGAETLKDFKKFFSRNHIIRVLEVLSSGSKIADNAKYEMKYNDSTSYIERSRKDKYKYKVSYNPKADKDYDSKKLVECLSRFSDETAGLYVLIRNLPSVCKDVGAENISIRLFSWLNSVESDFLKYKNSKGLDGSLLNESGILGPYMLSSNVGMLKQFDTILGAHNQPTPTKNGIEYLFSSVDYYLNAKAGMPILEKNLNLLSSYADVEKEKNILFRNSLFKSFGKDENFSYSKNVLSGIASLLYDFGAWIKSGEYDKATRRSLGAYDPKIRCETMVNQFVSKNACPNKEAVKLWGDDLLFQVGNVWETEMGSPIKHFFEGSKMGGHLEIPLYGKKRTKFRLTLEDNIRYLYDTSDRNLPVNNQFVKFVNEKNEEKKVNLTTLERVETVIREVRFGNNYLGATYLNFIVRGDDYVSDVKIRKRLMQLCVNTPGVRCGRKMSDSDIRMAKNALESFDSLLDVDNGRNMAPELRYGNFLKAFQQTLIASSARNAQELTLFPLSDEILKRHNGRVLGSLTMINAYSNAAWYVRDRIGRTRKDFEAFLAREDFKRVDRAFMNGFDLNQAVPAAERIVKKLRSTYPGETQNLFRNTVDWLSSLSYDEARLVEDTIGRLMVVGSYLGTPDVVFQKKDDSTLYSRYKNNNLFQVFMALDKLIDYWPVLKKYFPADSKLINVARPINNFLYFLTQKLAVSNNPQENQAYVALNDTFYLFQTLLFDEFQDGKIINRTEEKYKGFDFILAGLKNTGLVADSYSTIRDNYKFSNVFFENKGEFFMNLASNIKRIVKNDTVDLTPLREYLVFSSKSHICTNSMRTCSQNFHYDEPTSLLKYLAAKNDGGMTRVSVLNQKIFKENYSEIVELINDLLPSIKIRSATPPLRM